MNEPGQREIVSFITVSVNNRGQIVRREAAEMEQISIAVGGGQQIDLLALPGGVLQMGSPPGEGYDDERPQHSVSIRPFWIGRFPVTQAQ